jgi:hypothetical protein
MHMKVLSQAAKIICKTHKSSYQRLLTRQFSNNILKAATQQSIKDNTKETQ